jgi:regulator of replication initiation timing
MDAQQWTGLIQELRDAITNAKDTQVSLTNNSTEYTNTINNGFKLIQNTIHDIDGLIEQLTDLIAGLNRQITDFEVKQSADPTPRLTAEIGALQTQLSDAQAIQGDAVKAMQESIVALNANNEAMNTSAKSQDVAGLNKTITTTKTNLEEIKTRLQALLNQTPNTAQINNPESDTVLLNPRDQQTSQLPNNTLFELPDSDEDITYGDLKRIVQTKIDKITPEYIDAAKKNGTYNPSDPATFIPPKYYKFSNIINAVNANQDSIQNAIEQMIFSKEKDAKGNSVLVLQGGKLKRRSKHKISKKKSKMRRNKTAKQKRKQKHGYKYTLTNGLKYKKSHKRSIARL